MDSGRRKPPQVVFGESVAISSDYGMVIVGGTSNTTGRVTITRIRSCGNWIIT